MRLLPMLIALPTLMAQSPTPRAEALAWIEGIWLGELPGFHQEETWSAPAQGQVQGMVRERHDGRVLSISLFTVSQEKDALWLTLRHFDAELQPWAKEKKAPLRWKAAVAESNHVRFEQADGGIVDYRREGNLLQVQVDMPSPNGGRFRNAYTFKRRL